MPRSRNSNASMTCLMNNDNCSMHGLGKMRIWAKISDKLPGLAEVLSKEDPK